MQRLSFQVIPVVDLMRGQVVHAQMGQRNRYAPIKSRLCDSSNAFEIIAALLKLYPFQTLYIADIDAILGMGDHDALIAEIEQTFPALHLWLDAGNHFTHCKAKPVLGSESISNLHSYLHAKKPHVLSLDYNAQGAMGIAELHDSSCHWPDDVICMSLHAVGSQQGVDYKQIEHTKSLNQFSRLYAAGGVRHMADLKTLAKLGIAGALVASALHNGNITHDDLTEVYGQ